MQRLDWNLSRVSRYLLLHRIEAISNAAEQIWPQMRELNPEVFIRNVLITYLVSAMEEYLKGSYIARLTYAERKSIILKGIRLSGDQLAQISAGTLTVEHAAAEILPFQRLSGVGRHFAEINQKLDVLAPLRRPYRRRKVNSIGSRTWLRAGTH
jgi:hypothetical protein